MTNIYQPIVDKLFLDQYEDRPPDGRFHPSSLAGCDRLAVYETSGTEPTDDKDIRSIRIMGNGTHFHERIQAATKARYPGLVTEVEVEWGPISGSADALLPIGDGWNPDLYMDTPEGHENIDPVYELQEYKSIGPNGKRYLKDAKPEHVKQARIYYAGLESMGYLLDGIRIVYFDRDDWSVLEFEVEPWTPREVIELEHQLVNLENHVEEGTLPPRMPLDAKGQRFWLCRYCQFRTRCWEQDGESERG